MGVNDTKEQNESVVDRGLIITFLGEDNYTVLVDGKNVNKTFAELTQAELEQVMFNKASDKMYRLRAETTENANKIVSDGNKGIHNGVKETFHRAGPGITSVDSIGDKPTILLRSNS